MMKKQEVEKCIYKSFVQKKGAAISIPELKAYFQIVSEENMNDYGEIAQKILNELIENKYLNCDERPNGMVYLTEGLNFDQWETIMNPQTSNGGISIGSVNANNVQVGNQNTMNTGVTAEQFIKALTAFSTKTEPEKKSIMDKVLSAVSAGADVAAAVAAFIALV